MTLWLGWVFLLETALLATSGAHDAHTTPVGLVLWSHGRTASSTFCASLRDSSQLKYCQKGKETFSGGVTEEGLAKCMVDGDRLTHIKPRFLDKPGLNSTSDLMRAIKRSNVNTVIATYRDNELAHELSRFELSIFDGNVRFNRTRIRYEDDELRHAAAAETYCGDFDLTWEFSKRRRAWRDGVRDALRAGLSVKYYSFFNVTRNLCGCVQDTLTAVGLKGACAPRLLETTHSHNSTALEFRVGEAAAACIRERLDHPEYAWMLDDNVTREQPPPESAILPPI